MFLAMQRLRRESSRIARVRRAAEVCQELSQCVELLTPHALARILPGQGELGPSRAGCCCAVGWWVGLATAESSLPRGEQGVFQ